MELGTDRVKAQNYVIAVPKLRLRSTGAQNTASAHQNISAS